MFACFDRYDRGLGEMKARIDERLLPIIVPGMLPAGGIFYLLLQTLEA